MFIATLIAVERLAPGDISAALDALSAAGISATARDVEPGLATDLAFEGDAAVARAALEGLVVGIDVIVQPEATRAKRLLVADMDSTMITVECIDELADYAGIKAEIAAVTERAMRGELDFEAALDARVALLKGLDGSAIERCRQERVRLTAGAIPLIRTVKAHGGRCVLVSGGFTVFADKVAAEIGFDRAVSNTLGIADGRLTGTVARPIVGAETKRTVLLEEKAAGDVERGRIIAIGDGANDIPMIREAGLGVAFHAKPKTAEAAAARIDHGDLSALLYAQGYGRKEWVS